MITAAAGQRLVLGVVIAAASLAGTTAAATQDAASTTVLEPPLETLRPIPLPAPETLETPVAAQLAAAQSACRVTLAASDTSPADMAEAYGMLGQLYHAYEIHDAAEACYRNANRLAPQDPRWLHLGGYLREQTGNLPEAATLYAAAQRLVPQDVALAVRLGDTHLELDERDVARGHFEHALELDPRCAAALYGLGKIALADQRYDDAIHLLRQTLAIVPQANRLHYELAMAYRGLDDLDAARAELQRLGAVGIRPDDPLVDGLRELLVGERVHVLQGRMAYQAKRYHEAAAAFAKAVAANPSSIPARVNLGSTLAALGDSEGAMVELRAALELEPGNTNARYNLAVLEREQGDIDDALDNLRVVVRADPGDAEAHRQLGRTLLTANRPAEALLSFQAACALDPGDETTVATLAKLLVQSGRYAEAQIQLEAATRRDPASGVIAHDLARFLAACPDATLRNGERALDLATRVYRARPDLESGITLALALAEVGRCAEAAKIQRGLIDAAQRAGAVERLPALRGDLERFVAGPPCRPAAGP